MATTPRLTVDTTGVNHKLVWAGVYVGLLGTLLIGLGTTVAPAIFWIVGLVVGAVGGVLMLVGGALNDVEVREGHMPASEMRSETAALPSRSSDEQLALESGHVAGPVEPGPGADRLGGLMLLGLTAWLVLAPYVLSFEFTPEAERAIYHAIGLAIFTGVVGMRTIATGPSRVGSGLVALAAAVFLVYTLVRPGVANADQIIFLVTGALVILAAVLAATPRRQVQVV
ncbi:MAG: hypothetical protein Q7T56_11535 [Nocardioidaceae bacterium]|nr:hypothetical protein [Nocardioidaceae bacterium]